LPLSGEDSDGKREGDKGRDERHNPPVTGAGGVSHFSSQSKLIWFCALEFLSNDVGRERM